MLLLLFSFLLGLGAAWWLGVFGLPKSKLTPLRVDRDVIQTLTEAPIPDPDVADDVMLLRSPKLTDDIEENTQQLRDYLNDPRSKIRYEDHLEDPGKLFRVSAFAISDDSSFLTRFTVQFNLYAGTVAALGDDQQRKELFESRKRAELGCFAFTEVGAGVMTGIGVETTATYDETVDGFRINCPTTTARKNWISQGYVAEKAVVLARLIIKEKDHGPHLFWVRMRDGPKQPLKQGIIASLVPNKNALKGLDNAVLDFQDFVTPRSTLLGRFCSVDANGNYTSNTTGHRMLEFVILRLLTGRLCLSEWTLAYCLELMRHSWAYTEKRILFKGRKMADLPLMSTFFRDRVRCILMILAFIKDARDAACDNIRSGHFHGQAAEAASVSKFIGTSFAYDTVVCLKKMLGSQSLFEEARLGPHLDVFNACLFAEGDTLILEKKIVLDTATGKTARFDWDVMKIALQDPVARLVVFQYIKCLIKATLLGRKAKDEDQLLRDLAWAKAHLLVLTGWIKKGKNLEWLQSYADVLLKWPVPIIF